jgi:hypothetical protein
MTAKNVYNNKILVLVRKGGNGPCCASLGNNEHEQNMKIKSKQAHPLSGRNLKQMYVLRVLSKIPTDLHTI